MQTINIYSDESRHRAERFLLLGGLWVRTEDILFVEDEIKKIRKKHGYQNDSGQWVNFLGEFKWTKVSDKYLSVYKEVVDLFFLLIEKGKIRFCVMLVDAHYFGKISYNEIQ